MRKKKLDRRGWDRSDYEMERFKWKLVLTVIVVVVILVLKWLGIMK